MSGLRMAAFVFATVALTAGYFGHQWMTALGPEAVAEWTRAIDVPNLVLGWVLLVACIAFALVRGSGGEAA